MQLIPMYTIFGKTIKIYLKIEMNVVYRFELVKYIKKNCWDIINRR